jgi:thiol-disulfide isomerase/thioredoxin
LAGYISLPTFSTENVISIFFIYSLPLFVVVIVVSLATKAKGYEDMSQDFNYLKANESVFVAVLKEQPFYSVNKTNSHILFGNPEANLLITILTNPYCSPCAKMHKRIERFLSKMGDKVCIQYIFSFFDNDLKYSNYVLAGAFFDKSIGDKAAIFNEWFSTGVIDEASFYSKYKVDIDSEDVKNEIVLHDQWKENTKLNSTPTILVNGYQLPRMYKIEDLLSFSELQID